MADAIKISPQELRTAANDIEKKLQDAKDTLVEIQSQVNNTKAGWEGKSAEVYVEKFLTAKTDLTKKLEDSLMSLATNMRTVANEIEQRDRELAEQMKQLTLANMNNVAFTLPKGK